MLRPTEPNTTEWLFNRSSLSNRWSLAYCCPLDLQISIWALLFSGGTEIKNSCKKSIFFARKWMELLEEYLLIFQDEKLLRLSWNVSRKCEACLEARSWRPTFWALLHSKLKFNGKASSKIQAILRFACDKARLTSATLRDKIKDALSKRTALWIMWSIEISPFPLVQHDFCQRTKLLCS